MEQKNESIPMHLVKRLALKNALRSIMRNSFADDYEEELIKYFEGLLAEASRRKEIEVWEEARRMMIGNGCESGLCLKSWNEINSKLAALKGE